VPLPPSYCLDRSPSGAPVARFSAPGYLAEAVEREAWEDHRQQTGKPTPPR
jgi:hypothetical protein